jgi:hypothetical protein
MAAAFVQRTSGTAFSSPVASGSITVTAGNVLAIAVFCNVTTVTISSIAGNSNTYTLIDGPTDLSTSYRGWTYYVLSANSGATTVTVTFSAAVSYAAIVVHEISGLDTSAPLDQHIINGQNAPGTGTDAVTSTAKTTTASGEYIFGASSNANGSAVAAAGTGFTSRATADPASEDQIQGASGSIAATFTASDSFAPYLTALVTFKAASAGDTLMGGILL